LLSLRRVLGPPVPLDEDEAEPSARDYCLSKRTVRIADSVWRQPDHVAPMVVDHDQDVDGSASESDPVEDIEV
jgi:hypothetical protein